MRIIVSICRDMYVERKDVWTKLLFLVCLELQVIYDL